MKTFMASPATIERKWYVVDATGYTVGRLASEVAKVLRGKNKAIFTPHIDTGDYVIVVNADKITVTGKKMDQKIYYHHSDYVGGMKEATLKEMMEKKPEKVIEGMIQGRIKKELKEICLLDQVYVRAEDGKQSVAQYVEQVAKANGMTLKVKSVVRFETGEGLEKKQEDFAAEVAKQMGM
jgi:large subunit ribosomal protein L13